MATLSPTACVVYKKTAAGLELRADIYSPSKAVASQTVPVILFFNIGGLVFGARGDGLFPIWFKQAADEKGWLLVSVDY